MDETSLSLQPPLRACWMPRGQQTCIPAGLRETRCSLFGVYDWAEDTVLTMPAEKQNSETFNTFLDHVLVTCHPADTVVWVMDNAAWHHSAATRAALSLFEERVQFIYLPAYCSHLNPIERFWRHLKDQATANKLYLDLATLLDKIDQTVTAQNDLSNPDRFHLCH